MRGYDGALFVLEPAQIRLEDAVQPEAHPPIDTCPCVVEPPVFELWDLVDELRVAEEVAKGDVRQQAIEGALSRENGLFGRS